MFSFLRKTAPTSDLEARIERLERAVRDLRTDWDTTYDKFAMIMKRLAKRDKAAAEPIEQASPLRDLVTKLGGNGHV